jgi:SNF2 family DNA or RNA helicase
MGSRLLKDDVLDLPPKLYDKRTFDMCPEQKRIYDELKREFIIWLDSGDMVTAPLAITRMLRLQQITSGYCPTDDGGVLRITPNARLTCLMDLLEDVPHQAIVWAKFQADVDAISGAIGYDNCVVYDGRVSQADREDRRVAFKDGQVQFFVANPAAAGEGLTLTEARTVIYFNSTYKLADRLQSEDRAHRIGQEHPVQYIDIIARGTIDTAILRALRMKVDLAAQVTGDAVRSWI